MAKKTRPEKLEYLRRWRAAHPRYKRDWYQRRKQEGGFPSYWKRRHPPQKGPCPICRQERDLVRDHDHVTGKWRERICSKCNAALGFLEDCPEAMRAAASYVEKWRALHSAGEAGKVGG